MNFDYHIVEPGQLWIAHDIFYGFREKSVQIENKNYVELEEVSILKNDKFLILDTSNQSQKGRIKILIKQNVWYIRDIAFDHCYRSMIISKL
jgi:hypothetical protein